MKLIERNLGKTSELTPVLEIGSE
uniref:Uncharacterized protein n=1 Tax=Tetranychus urticae TaxID=32264 RepID=T1JQK8_TETUR